MASAMAAEAPRQHARPNCGLPPWVCAASQTSSEAEAQAARTWAAGRSSPPPPEPGGGRADDQELSFLKAAQILLSPPPRPRKFGWDFHMVHFVIALIPSLGVYLVAQYARGEMAAYEKEKEARQGRRAVTPQPSTAARDQVDQVESLTNKSGQRVGEPRSGALTAQPEEKVSLGKAVAELRTLQAKVQEVEAALQRLAESSGDGLPGNQHEGQSTQARDRVLDKYNLKARAPTAEVGVAASEAARRESQIGNAKGAEETSSA
eukprot:SM000006S19421  [mRNA]  locus=s6:642183:643793:- [translate_table: standard]